MDPQLPSGLEELNVRNSTSIPSHGTVPKWFEDISEKVVKDHAIISESKSLDFRNFFDTVAMAEAAPRESSSARFGRRSSLAAQIIPEVTNITTTASDYLVPRLDPMDFKALHADPYQITLEKSWKSLDDFKQSHKGRLDSAKNLEAKVGDYDYVLSPISSNDSSEGETPVPNLFAPPGAKFRHDPIFEKKLSDYRSRIDKENKLREEIISELLVENEHITEKLKQRHDDEEFFAKKLYHNNSKYRNNAKKGRDVFIIPELPTGKTLIIDILTTWGDKYYVGLNGIEIFGLDGAIVPVQKITAVPPDVNVLPECNNDPRIVSNLLDGVNRTQDDMHIWLAPFEVGCNHIITVEFKDITTLSMIRIWNYNKSRIHSYRGVRDIVMFLDDQPIFKGEIAKACGGILGGVDAFGDTILFTTDEAILENIAKNDSSFSYLTSEPSSPTVIERPPTATLTSEMRPITGPSRKTLSPTDQILLGASQMDLVLLSNWGHPTKIGLTGIEIVHGPDSAISLNQSHLSCSSKSVQLSRLINDVNITTDAGNMWWVPFKFGEEVHIRIVFDGFKYVSGVRIWNYNGSLESSYAGVRALRILLDGAPVKNPITKNEIFILRRAPGNQHYDFVQELRFVEDTVDEDEIPSLLDKDEFYEPSSMPEGFVFQLIIFSSWGDQYYCGLNGLELYNQYGKKVELEEQNICAYPESVNSLPDVVGDIRTPDKLIDGVNGDHSGSHSWLAPIVPKHLNRIYIVMDQPIVVSLVKLWNYSKSPNRGIKEFGILVDDLLVYNGTLARFSPHMDDYQTVLFTENEAVIGEEYDNLIRNSAYSQDTVLVDQNTRTTTGGSLPEADPALRPFTSVSPYNRGYTSFSN